MIFAQNWKKIPWHKVPALRSPGTIYDVWRASTRRPEPNRHYGVTPLLVDFACSAGPTYLVWINVGEPVLAYATEHAKRPRPARTAATSGKTLRFKGAKVFMTAGGTGLGSSE